MRGIIFEDARTVCLALTSNRNKKVCGSEGHLAVQVYYLPRGITSIRELREGKDTSCPDSCAYRSKVRGGNGNCYVLSGFRSQIALEKILRAVHAGTYPRIDLDRLSRGIETFRWFVRVGAYGDPTSVPWEVNAKLLTSGRWSGYTVAWREVDAGLHGDPALWRGALMASVTTLEDATAARAGGWRTYRSGRDLVLAEGERRCPAAKEASTHGKLSCSTCRQCDGTLHGSKRPSFALNVHR